MLLMKLLPSSIEVLIGMGLREGIYYRPTLYHVLRRNSMMDPFKWGLSNYSQNERCNPESMVGSMNYSLRNLASVRAEKEPDKVDYYYCYLA